MFLLRVQNLFFLGVSAANLLNLDTGAHIVLALGILEILGVFPRAHTH